jgi:hypothetical protein
LALFSFIFRFDKQKVLWKEPTIMLVIFISTALFHILFAGLGWFYRYEAYLMALGIFVIALGICEYLPEKASINFNKALLPKYIATGILILFINLPLAIMGFGGLIFTPQAAMNIYGQQYQMGLFLKKFYQGKAVAANDIGAISYLADIDCLDLWGLENLEVAKLKMKRNYKTQQIYNLTKKKKVKIAIVYNDWFESNEIGGIPPQWVKVGQLKISRNIVYASSTVSFYAVDPAEKDNLIENLKIFSYRLP